MHGSAIDFGFLPTGTNCDVQIFYGSANATTQWQQWVKPRGMTMAHMIAIGGGGGGGGGFTGASTTARGGGAGGACSSVASSLYPIIGLPDVLKISVGSGGLGGSGSGVAGGAGTNSYIATGVGLTAGTSIPNMLLQSGINAAGGGAAGTGAGTATGGSVPTITTIASLGWAAGFAIQRFAVGIVGAAGGSPTAAGTAVTTVWSLIPVSQGTGGGGVTNVNTGFAGGALQLTGAIDIADGNVTPAAILAGGTAGSGVLAGGNGNAGVQYWKPLIGTGGTGGGSADGQPGGIGGKGAIGCGGGGGGAGTTGGRGGDGGNGLVIIISW